MEKSSQLVELELISYEFHVFINRLFCFDESTKNWGYCREWSDHLLLLSSEVQPLWVLWFAHAFLSLSLCWEKERRAAVSEVLSLSPTSQSLSHQQKGFAGGKEIGWWERVLQVEKKLAGGRGFHQPISFSTIRFFFFSLPPANLSPTCKRVLQVEKKLWLVGEGFAGGKEIGWWEGFPPANFFFYHTIFFFYHTIYFHHTIFFFHHTIYFHHTIFYFHHTIFFVWEKKIVW